MMSRNTDCWANDWPISASRDAATGEPALLGPSPDTSIAWRSAGGATVALSEKDGGTLLSYNVEAQIGGKLAQVLADQKPEALVLPS